MDSRELLEYIFRGGGKQVVTTLPEGIHKQFEAKDVDAAWEYIVEQGKHLMFILIPMEEKRICRMVSEAVMMM